MRRMVATGCVVLAASGLALAACGAVQPAPAEPLERPPPRTPPSLPAPPSPVPGAPAPVAAADPRGPRRPALDLTHLEPDLAPVLRWPLRATEHPELQPAFPIARALAEPGLDWLALCARRVQDRRVAGPARENIAYLRAWCRVADHDLADAIAQLAPLTTSTRPALAHAARRDIAFVIASETDPDEAYRLLGRLARGPAGADLEILDTLSAALLELGNDVMGGQVNERALDSTAPSLPGPRCQRLARRIALRGRVDRAGARRQFEVGPWPTDARCQQLVRVVGCYADPGTRCQDHFADTGVDARYFDLLFAYHAWRDPVPPWREIGTRALLAAGLDGAELMSARALEAALMRTWCDGDEARELRELAWRLEVAVRGRPDLPAAERAEIEAITARLADRAGPRCRHRPPREIE